MLFIQNTQLKWSLLKDRHHHHLMVSEREGEDMVDQDSVELCTTSSNQSHHYGDNIVRITELFDKPATDTRMTHSLYMRSSTRHDLNYCKIHVHFVLE